MANKIQLEIVSLAAKIFSGNADAIFITGTVGEMGIYPGHAPLLSSIKPGQIRLLNDGKYELYYVSGGIVEVQPKIVTVLADTVVRAQDLDEAKALEAQKQAEKRLQERRSDLEYSQAIAELARAAAQLRTIRELRQKYRL